MQKHELGGECYEILSSKNDMAIELLNSQQLWLPVQDLQEIESSNVLYTPNLRIIGS